MRVSKIEINKYKSIKRPFVLEEPGKLHLFIGANNAGKTNILDAIHQLYNTDKMRYKDTKTRLKITFTLISKSGKTFTAEQKGITKVFKIDNRKIINQRAFKILDQHVIRIGATNPISINRLQDDYSKFRINYKKEFSLFSNTLAKYIPQIKLTNIFDRDYHIQENDVARPFERLGDGFQQVFIILMYLFNPQYKILLLEEPEIHLHPALIKKLLKILEDRNYENQIFLTTHSPIFIHTTNLHRIVRVVKEKQGTVVYSPRLTGRKLNYTRLKQELNAENSEMLFTDKVLLVEGPSDHILLRGLIDRFYDGEKDIKVIQTYGKSNVDVYTELLEIFNIPYSVLLDRDALYDTGVKLLDSKIKREFTKSEPSLIKMLKKHNIYILPNGAIERNYPKKYQKRRNKKMQNAMYAASHLTKKDYNSPLMKNIKEVIDKL